MVCFRFIGVAVLMMRLERLCVFLLTVASATVGPQKLGAFDLEKLIGETVAFPEFVDTVLSGDETSDEEFDSPQRRRKEETDDESSDFSDAENSDDRLNHVATYHIIAIPDRLRFVSDLNANKHLSTITQCRNMRAAIKALLRFTASMNDDLVFQRIRADWNSVLKEVNRIIDAYNLVTEIDGIIYADGGVSTTGGAGVTEPIPPLTLPRKRSISGEDVPKGIQSPPGRPPPPPTPTPTAKAAQQLTDVQTTERPTIHGS